MKYLKDLGSKELISKEQMGKINENFSKLELKYSLHIYPNVIYSNISFNSMK